MPIALTPVETGNRFDGCRSVLIVPCRVCPGMCLAAEQGRPFMSAGNGRDPLTVHVSCMRNRNKLKLKGEQ